MYDVFISYNSKDYGMAFNMYDFLTKNGLNVFFSRKSLPEISQSQYRKAIDDALDESVHMLVVCSNLSYLESKWVDHEITFFSGEKLEGRKPNANIILIVTDNLYEIEVRNNNKKNIPAALRQEQMFSIDDNDMEKSVLSYFMHNKDNHNQLLSKQSEILVSTIKKLVGENKNISSKTVDAVNKTYKTGDIIEFGWYPQTKETDLDVINELIALAGDNKKWQSYGYYSGSGELSDGQMKPSRYMRFKDVTFGNTRYRGVMFDLYRPKFTGEVCSADNSIQYNNGYISGKAYWFKYEPIKWRVLDPAKGLVLSVNILDSQAYNNYMLAYEIDQYDEDAYWGDSVKTYYANNYAKSSIRQWLNNDFYKTAFSTSQQDIIQATTIDNSAYGGHNSAYDSESTTDKIYLLSWNDALNSNYGFSTIFSTTDKARKAQGTDYAKCQGLGFWIDRSYSENSGWRLRSAGDDSGNTCYVDYGGYVGGHYNTYDTNYGVRAALNLNLNSDIFQSNVSEIDNKQ